MPIKEKYTETHVDFVIDGIGEAREKRSELCAVHVHETQKVYEDWTHIKQSHNGGLLSEHSNLPRLSRAVHRHQMAVSDLAS